MTSESEGRAAIVAPKGEGVHNFIREWRMYRDIKQEDLAARVKVSQASISLLENGRTGYRQSILEKIAEVLDCTPAELIGIDPFVPPPPPPPPPAPQYTETEQALLDLPEEDKRLAHALLKVAKEARHEC